MKFNFNRESHFLFREKFKDLKPLCNIDLKYNQILQEERKKTMLSGTGYKQYLSEYEKKNRLVLSLINMYKNIDPSYIIYFVDLAYSNAPLENPEIMCELAIRYIERYQEQKGDRLSNLILSYEHSYEENKEYEKKIISRIRSYNTNEFVFDSYIKDKEFPYNCILDKLARRLLTKGNVCDSLVNKYEKGLKVLRQTDFLKTKGCLFHVLSKIFNIDDFQKILLVVLKLEEYGYNAGKYYDILILERDAILINVNNLCHIINFLIGKESIIGCGNDEVFSIMKVADSSTTHFLIISHLDDKIYDPYATLRKHMMNKEDLSIEYVWTFDSFFKRTV
jgi:hypothetical protein